MAFGPECPTLGIVPSGNSLSLFLKGSSCRNGMLHNSLGLDNSQCMFEVHRLIFVKYNWSVLTEYGRAAVNCVLLIT
jgi:hypothetical protein